MWAKCTYKRTISSQPLHRRFQRSVAIALLTSLATLVGACGADTETGVRAVSPNDAFAVVFENPPEGLVVLDVRTPEEFVSQRLPNATMIDFYSPDFAQQIASLDRETPYLLYCRSGNRSGQAADLMTELGFTDVQEVDGGIVSWLDAGHPFATSND